jgi:hypothetical protein
MTNSTTTTANRLHAEYVREIATPAVGRCIWFDGGSTCGTLLCEADDYSDSSFPGCKFRSDRGIAMNVKVTGRTFQTFHGVRAVRVEVEFVGDGEPSEFVHGWMAA